MTNFKETVEKIATSPWKCALLPRIPSLLHKEAGRINDTFNTLFGSEGAQDVAKNIASGVGQATVLGLGGYGAAKLLAEDDAEKDRFKGRQTTMGKLDAEQQFRQRAFKKLGPQHLTTFEGLQADPILAKADPALMQSSFDTMKRFAPNLASDPNATRAFLQEAALYGKGPSYATLKTLAEAERAIQQSQGL